MIVSLGFIASQWCLYELYLTNMLAVEEKKSKLVVLVKETVPKENTPQNLRQLLETRTYITWDDDGTHHERVWKKLKRIFVPSGSNGINTCTVSREHTTVRSKSANGVENKNNATISNISYEIDSTDPSTNLYLSQNGVVNPSFSPYFYSCLIENEENIIMTTEISFSREQGNDGTHQSKINKVS